MSMPPVLELNVALPETGWNANHPLSEIRTDLEGKLQLLLS
jgi:hypothetical protein